MYTLLAYFRYFEDDTGAKQGTSEFETTAAIPDRRTNPYQLNKLTSPRFILPAQGYLVRALRTIDIHLDAYTRSPQKIVADDAGNVLQDSGAPMVDDDKL